jgi:hypothetical protein
MIICKAASHFRGVSARTSVHQLSCADVGSEQKEERI